MVEYCKHKVVRHNADELKYIFSNTFMSLATQSNCLLYEIHLFKITWTKFIKHNKRER